MKKFLLITFVMFVHTVYAQNSIPSKLLKGIEVTTDEFSSVKTYTAKNCCIEIEHVRDSIRLYIILSCSQFDTPVNLKTIHILTGGNTTTIQHNDNFTIREVPMRVMTQNSTGTFGTSSYKAAQFNTRNQYVETWKEDAAPYMPIIESIINNLGKVKFEGENNTLYLEFSKKDAQRMQAMLALYEYIR